MMYLSGNIAREEMTYGIPRVDADFVRVLEQRQTLLFVEDPFLPLWISIAHRTKNHLRNLEAGFPEPVGGLADARIDHYTHEGTAEASRFQRTLRIPSSPTYFLFLYMYSCSGLNRSCSSGQLHFPRSENLAGYLKFVGIRATELSSRNPLSATYL